MGAPAVSVRGSAAVKAPARRHSASTARTAAARRSAAAARASARTASPRRAQAPARSRSGATASRAASARGRSRITPPGGMAMIPVHAVGGAAGAVGGIADSGLVVGMTRGRLWIAVLGVLLGGIVALNVWGLSLSASTNGTASKIDELERANTVLGAKIAKRTSSDRVQAIAAGLGLQTPTPKAVNYLKVRGGDAATAAERIASGEVSLLASLPIAPELADAAAVPVAAAAPVDPAAGVPAAPVETVPEPAPVAPEAAVPVAPVTSPETQASPPPSTSADGGVTVSP